MTKVNFNRSWDITDEFIKDVVIDTAGYGIGYWSDLGEIDDEARTYTVREFETGDTTKVDYDDPAAALVRVAYDSKVAVDGDIRDYARAALDEIEAGEEFPGGDIDADVADVIVQVAVFGEVIYG